MKKIDFLIIGVQKSGTTVLDTYLREHPTISMGKTKELHYFDNEKLYEEDNDYAKYHLNFEDFLNPSFCFGEATPIYSYWNNAIKRIHKYNPNIKLIIILRNPIERAYSHWNMEFNKNKDSDSFSSAIRNENIRTREALPHKHRVYSYVDRGFYAEQLRNIYRYFPRENLLVLRHEDLSEKFQSTLLSVTNFLKLKEFSFKELFNVHTGKYEKKISFDDHNYLHKIFFNDIKEVERILDWDCSSWLKPIKPKKILFFRDYKSYTGGHQKVFDYYAFFKKYKMFEVSICFSKDSVWDISNPWIGEHRYVVDNPNLEEYDILFVAGMDWKKLPKGIENKKIVINLIQGLRHGNEELELNSFLKRKAIRISVSVEVTNIIKKYVKNKIYTIENGVSLSPISKNKIFDIYILGTKNPKLAQQIFDTLNKLNFIVNLTIVQISKEEVYVNMAESRITVVLPNFEEGEGFFIPALEAMFYSDLVIVPDCIGNRSFCIDGFNCVIPTYSLEDIIAKIKIGNKMIINEENIILKENALSTVKKYSLSNQYIKMENFMKEELDV